MSTDTQPRPNISTENQAEGDARHPSDTLDKEQQPGGSATQLRPNLSSDPHNAPDTSQDDNQPADRPEDPRETTGGNDQEAPEDRPNVGSVTSDDYPADERHGGVA